MRPLLLALLLAGCQVERPCRTLTLLVTVTLDAGSAAADQLEVDVSIDGTPSKTNLLAHVPGDPGGTIEIDFASGYPAGHQVGINIQAYAGGQPLGSGSATTTLPDDCGTLAVAVAH